MGKYKPGTYDSAFAVPISYRQDGEVVQHPEPGISKRLYIAVEIIKGLVVNPEGMPSKNALIDEGFMYADEILAKEYEGTKIE